MERKSVTAAKFTSLARGWSQREYREPIAFMERRAALVRQWGPRLQPGDRILELGCGDGALSCLLASQGFEVTGVDISPGMIEEAKERAVRAGVIVRFELADSDSFQIVEPYDGVISFMSAFFTYLENPARFLEAALPFVRKKIVVDWNFRSPGSLVQAAELMQGAGFRRLEWRPWFIPHTNLSASASRLRNWVEERPILSLILLILRRWHYTVYLKGEPAAGRTLGGRAVGGELHGNRLPGSLLQRFLIKLGQVTK
jgi:SAM-dependent methyltransferase